MAGHLTMDLKPKHASALQKQLTPRMWEQARQGQEGYNFSTVFRKSGFGLVINWTPCRHHRHTAKGSHHHQTDTSHGQTDVSSRHFFKPQVCRTIWHTEFIGDLVLVNCCPFEGGDVGQSMHWHTECFMRVMFRSWSLAVQILVRERLEARCEELKSQTGDRPNSWLP